MKLAVFNIANICVFYFLLYFVCLYRYVQIMLLSDVASVAVIDEWFLSVPNNTWLVLQCKKGTESRSYCLVESANRFLSQWNIKLAEGEKRESRC